jgi:endonuclease I
MKYVYPQIRLTNVIDKKTLLKWNDIYPVSKEEFERNKLIKELQGNTNPFIDGSIRFN